MRLRSPLIASALIVLVSLICARVSVGHRTSIREEGASQKQIAIIPFLASGTDKDVASLGEDMATHLTNRLNKLYGLSILGQDVVRQQVSKKADSAETLAMARQLGIDTLVTGTFKKSGAKLELECSIVDVASGQVSDGKAISISKEFPSGYVSLLRDLADKVESALRPTAASGARPQPLNEAEVSNNVEAHELYSDGLQKWQSGTREELTEARNSFRQAVDKDQDYGEAFAALSDSETQLAILKEQAGEDAEQDKRDAVAHAFSAVKKAPYFGGAHWQLSRALLLVRDYEGAARSARVANILWPADAEVYVDLSRALAQGQLVDSPELEQALKMTPALVLIEPELPKVTLVNDGAAAVNVKFTQDSGKVFSSVNVPAGGSRIAGLVTGHYSVSTSGGDQAKTQALEFSEGTPYSLDGRTLAPRAAEHVSPGKTSEKPVVSHAQVKPNPKTKAEMVYVPEGEFTMGDTTQEDNKPHKVSLSGYWIGRVPVMVKEFRAYTDDKEGYEKDFGKAYDWEKYKPSRGWVPDHPMVKVSWSEARAFCKWAGGDLASEAQWEHAARGPEGLVYPWGNQWDAERLQWNLGSDTAPVKAHAAAESAYGCMDMAGNVLQWCLDGYQADLSSLTHDPVGSGDQYVLRGSALGNNGPKQSRLTCREERLAPDTRLPRVGFRVAITDAAKK